MSADHTIVRSNRLQYRKRGLTGNVNAKGTEIRKIEDMMIPKK